MKTWLAAFGLAACAATATAQAPLPRIELTAGFHRIEAEVAATPAHRQVGLMARRTMPEGHGMLFVFAERNTHCMWMKNTRLPLSVAFIDEAGVVINIADMQPESEESHCAKVPARYALEMNQGWFARRGLGPGTRLGGLDKAPAPR